MIHPIILCIILGISFPTLAGPQNVAKQSDTPANQSNLTPKDIARAFVQEQWQKQKTGTQLRFIEQKSSLLATHVRFQQIYQGMPIQNASLVVSVSKKDASILKVSDGTYSLPKNTAKHLPKWRLSREDALDVSWHHLQVQGSLFTEPQTEEVWLFEKNKLRLVHRVWLETDAPHGSWLTYLDALTGQVIHTKNIVTHGKNLEDFHPQGGLSDLNTELKRLKKRQVQKSKQNKATVDGTGLVFDPDPRTTLMDGSLVDTSPAAAFEDAYFSKTLRDIEFDENTGLYKLNGPWIQIIDFEFPNTPPSTSADGNWTAKRGDNAFNDAMTYFHVDQTQRYLQALGFTGDTGIQEFPMETDTDGQNGVDDSGFYAGSNRLTFGHGCVDDNEDADVILHEYGHAINFGIQDLFIFDDAEAISEGFGDYWAGSYSLKTPNGPLFHPEWVYSWDGHGEPEPSCWIGRVFNAFELQYDENRSYNIAHEPIGPNFLTADELWSTPSFQALYECYNRGLPMAEMDQIMVEGYFGLTQTKMPDVAQSIVNAAKNLYPNGPHAQILQANFARQNILPQQDSYQYIAPHIPPSAGETAWTSSLVLSNPNDETAEISFVVYERDNEGAYLVIDTQTESLEGHKAMSFSPTGTGQRWVAITANLPLTGRNKFQRSPGEDRGHEAAAIPFIGATETAKELILPHVPSDREKFWSGAVILNPTDSTQNLSITLIGDQGSDLSHLLNEDAPTQLAAFQKVVTYLAPGPNNAAGLFDDSSSTEKVAYVQLSADDEIASFQLYGYQIGQAATSGIVATPNQHRTHYPVRLSLTHAEWSGFSLLNPGDEAVTLDIIAYATDGSVLATEQITVAAKQKLLGLNHQTNGFTFPSNGTPILSIPSNLERIVITANETAKTFGIGQPLRVFELTGDLDSSQLDGAVVNSLATKIAFPNPEGTLHLFKTDHDGEIQVTYHTIDGLNFSEIVNMSAGESVSMTTSPEGSSISTIEISGQLFTAALIAKDERGSLTVINGKSMEQRFNVSSKN